MATPLTPAEMQHQQDHLNDDAKPNIIVANVVCLSLACVAVALRFICRRMSGIKYELDDWLILASLVSPSSCVQLERRSLTYIDSQIFMITFVSCELKGRIHISCLLIRPSLIPRTAVVCGGGRHSTIAPDIAGFSKVCCTSAILPFRHFTHFRWLSVRHRWRSHIQFLDLPYKVVDTATLPQGFLL